MSIEKAHKQSERDSHHFVLPGESYIINHPKLLKKQKELENLYEKYRVVVEENTEMKRKEYNYLEKITKKNKLIEGYKEKEILFKRMKKNYGNLEKEKIKFEEKYENLSKLFEEMFEQFETLNSDHEDVSQCE